MSPNGEIKEDSAPVLTLAGGKTRLRIAGRSSIYRLRNGWIARRQAPENGWARQAYWSLYETEAHFQQNRSLGGGEGRLTRAIANVLSQPGGNVGSSSKGRKAHLR